ncbi:hypothetical protein JX265_004439 [Neoarthrinium moseri]|uniref:Hydroxybutyrate dehydrogenase n=1 Tax=Neoarthrinium moseri TaxID=1658444 RepID=A0A9P9WR54_9PEZI|nr:hypothetical protein JX265_004439 [Neoarthrinium moseri]
MSSTQTVLITGCSDGGIGSALALIFPQRGFHVFATARDVSKMSKLNCLSNVTLLTLDVVKSDHMKVVVETVSQQTGGTLNCFISNAGRNHFIPDLDENLDQVKELFDINLWGPIALTQAFAPLLIKAGGTYAASKKSIEIVADTLRLELAPFGVSVLKVVTGGVKSLGQTYIEDFALSAQSLYKEIENAIASRAQGNVGMPRMDTMEYALAVADEITKRTSG